MMRKHNLSRSAALAGRGPALRMEPLESRRLLSAAPVFYAHPEFPRFHFGPAMDVRGPMPAQPPDQANGDAPFASFIEMRGDWGFRMDLVPAGAPVRGAQWNFAHPGSESIEFFVGTVRFTLNPASANVANTTDPQMCDDAGSAHGADCVDWTAGDSGATSTQSDPQAGAVNLPAGAHGPLHHQFLRPDPYPIDTNGVPGGWRPFGPHDERSDDGNGTAPTSAPPQSADTSQGGTIAAAPVPTAPATAPAAGAPVFRKAVLRAESVGRSEGTVGVPQVATVSQTAASQTPVSASDSIAPVPATVAKPTSVGSASLSALSSVGTRATAYFFTAFYPGTDMIFRVVGIAPATTGAGEVSLPPAATGAGPGNLPAAPAPAVALAAHVVPSANSALHALPIDAAALFSDAILAFANDSTAPGDLAAAQPRRAWAVTAAVLAADAILVGRWYAKRAKARKTPAKDEAEEQEPKTVLLEDRPMIALHSRFAR